jgi:hypothetical protein
MTKDILVKSKKRKNLLSTTVDQSNIFIKLYIKKLAVIQKMFQF